MAGQVLSPSLHCREGLLLSGPSAHLYVPTRHEAGEPAEDRVRLALETASLIHCLGRADLHELACIVAGVFNEEFWLRVCEHFERHGVGRDMKLESHGSPLGLGDWNEPEALPYASLLYILPYFGTICQ